MDTIDKVQSLSFGRIPPRFGIAQPAEQQVVVDAVRQLPGWYLADRKRTLGVRYRFRDSAHALRFLASMTEIATTREANPHLILTAGGQLHLRVRSRQAGGVGEHEIEFARAVSDLFRAA